MNKKEKSFARLSNSIYKKNLQDVWNILEDYPKSCRKIFLENVKKLSFRHVTLEELRNMTNDKEVNGLYIPTENVIYLNDLNNTQSEINHELFHVASCTKRFWGIIIDLIIDNKNKTIGELLNEGITEYLALLSVMGEKEITSAYQLEVFVIETLIDIYDKNILIPYFKNNPLKFYTQFKNNKHHIIKLDILLNKISKTIDVRNTFEEYILIKDLSKDKLKQHNLYFQTENMEELTKFLKKHKEEISLLCEEIENESGISNKDTIYTLKELENERMYINWYKEYDYNQKVAFEKIIKTLIILARKNKYSDKRILKILRKNLSNKETALDIIEYKNKKLIKRRWINEKNSNNT